MERKESKKASKATLVLASSLTKARDAAFTAAEELRLTASDLEVDFVRPLNETWSSHIAKGSMHHIFYASMFDLDENRYQALKNMFTSNLTIDHV